MSRQWFSRPERSNPFTLKLILWIARHSGRWVARALLYPITVYFLVTAPRERRVSRDYLTRVLGRPASGWDTARHFYYFAATLLDRIYFLMGQHQRFRIRLYNTEALLARVRLGQGCLLLGAHLGSFEVLRSLAVNQRRLRLKVLMYQDHNPMITRLLEGLNPEIADTVINLGAPDSLIRVKHYVDQGTVIGMLGDRVAESDKVIPCRFLGENALFPAGPMLLASALTVPVILFIGLYRGGSRYDIYFELLAEQVTLDHARRAEDLQRYTQAYVDRLEYYARAAPYNWFNFYDYWDQATATLYPWPSTRPAGHAHQGYAGHLDD